MDTLAKKMCGAKEIVRPDFSLVIATVGRKDELYALFDSILVQTYPLQKVQCILVDQNPDGYLDDIVASYSGKIDILHVKSKLKGLSRNRNLGLTYAEADIVCFPDDDCTYYPDTLQRVHEVFESSPEVKVVCGAIKDRKTGNSIIKKWPDNVIVLNKRNFYKLCSSITLFVRNIGMQFDENLGAGTYFGSCEDTDYLFNYVKKGYFCIYNPIVEVWHPDVALEDFTFEKNKSYGRGFGAFCVKNLSHFSILMLFACAIGYHFLLMVVGILTLDAFKARVRFDAMVSRLKGVFHGIGRKLYKSI